MSPPGQRNDHDHDDRPAEQVAAPGVPARRTRRNRRGILSLGAMGLTLAVLVGAVAGLGFYTFGYGEGLSYFSTDPTACKNCHIMNDQFDSWTKAGHHQAAGCVDCHLPAHGIPKYIAKAENGFWHSKGFTFNDFHEPIMIARRNPKILQDNCLRCHGDFVHDMVAGSTTAEDAVTCVHCHRGVGHGARHGSLELPDLPRTTPVDRAFPTVRKDASPTEGTGAGGRLSAWTGR